MEISGTYLLLGSNLGDREFHLAKARETLVLNAVTINRQSNIFESEAWGNTLQQDFLNQVLAVQHDFEPQLLLEKLQAIEQSLGRQRIEKWGARTIDIDILFIGNQLFDFPNLKVPHPEIPNRKFTLIPLIELLGEEAVFPGLQVNLGKLLSQCKDELKVWKFEG
jgi:2-amino-4-hydroxy-6-hydroxymethyldihydropteridine diphosphokinase